MTDKTSYLRDELAALVDQGLYNTITTIDGPQGPWLSVGGRDVLNFCSNNYLGLGNDDRLVEAAKAAGSSAGVAVLVTVMGVVRYQFGSAAAAHRCSVGVSKIMRESAGTVIQQLLDSSSSSWPLLHPA